MTLDIFQLLYCILCTIKFIYSITKCKIVSVFQSCSKSLIICLFIQQSMFTFFLSGYRCYRCKFVKGSVMFLLAMHQYTIVNLLQYMKGLHQQDNPFPKESHPSNQLITTGLATGASMSQVSSEWTNIYIWYTI